MDDWLISMKLKGKKKGWQRTWGANRKWGQKLKFFPFGQWPSTNYICERLSAGSLLWTDATHSQIIEFTSSGSSSWGQWPGVSISKTRNLIKLECTILFYQCPWRTGKKMKWEIFRIDFLVTRIQFLDCNSCTMLFKHSQFRLWVRDWIFHPLVVKKLV